MNTTTRKILSGLAGIIGGGLSLQTTAAELGSALYNVFGATIAFIVAALFACSAAFFVHALLGPFEN